jgi:hypothetical protein
MANIRQASICRDSVQSALSAYSLGLLTEMLKKPFWHRF